VQLRIGADELCPHALSGGASAGERDHRLGEVDAEAAAIGVKRPCDRDRGAAGTAADVEHRARRRGPDGRDEQILEWAEESIEHLLRLHPGASAAPFHSAVCSLAVSCVVFMVAVLSWANRRCRSLDDYRSSPQERAAEVGLPLDVDCTRGVLV